MNDAQARARVETIARAWIGTPFHDHGRVKGAGCDCATLLLETYAEAGLIPHTDVGYYSPQFFCHSSEERYLGWVKKFACEIPRERVQQADIALWKIGKCFAHAAIVIAPGWPAIIHANFASRCVRIGDGRWPRLGRTLDLKFFSLWAD